MAQPPDRLRSNDQKKDSAEDPRWDRKQGAAKPGRMARDVEKSSSRYSASEQSEQQEPATPPTKNTTRKKE